MRDPKEHQVLAGDFLVMGPYKFKVTSLQYTEYINEATLTEGAALSIEVAAYVEQSNGGT